MTVVSDTPLTPREKKVLSGALTRAGIPSSSVTLTHVCPQTNYTAFRAAKSRAGFLAALGAPVVIVPLGSDALYNLMGLVFVLGTIISMGLSLTIAQITGPLRNARFVIMALMANFVVPLIAAFPLIRVFALNE